MEEQNKEIKIQENSANIQVYNIVTSRDPSWQSIIYDLIASEQLDPWNIDIGVLCKSYFDKIRQLEESDFHISSKVLLAASLLLRIKSEILLNKYMRDIDSILFPRDEEIKSIIERIEIDESEIPILSPKTPLPRFKKVTLQELIGALDVAIKTESRRIDKEIQKKQAQRLSHVDIPKFRRINIKERIRHFYAKILTGFKNKKAEIKLPYSHFTGSSKEERIACFLPMLYLSNHGKLWLEQDKHFSEIWVYLYNIFKKSFPDHDKDLLESEEEREMRLKQETDEVDRTEYDNMEEELEEINGGIDNLKKEGFDLKESEKQKRVEELNKDFENPVGDFLSR